MTSTKFRFFLISSFLIGVAGSIFEFFAQTKMSPELIAGVERLPGHPSDVKLLIAAIAGLIAIVLMLVSCIGLFWFRRWAPNLALTSTFLAMLSVSMMGSTIVTSISTMATYASTLLWGSVLAVAHTPYYAEYAKRQAQELLSEA